MDSYLEGNKKIAEALAPKYFPKKYPGFDMEKNYFYLGYDIENPLTVITKIKVKVRTDEDLEIFHDIEVSKCMTVR